MTKFAWFLAAVLANTAPLAFGATQSWGLVDSFSDSGTSPQVGSNLDGDGQQVIMGTSTSATGVAVYEQQAGVWTKSAVLSPPVPTNVFGLTVAIDGTWAAVAGGTVDTYLFKRNAGVWSYFQSLRPIETGGTVFAYDMDLSGDTLAVGDYTRSNPSLGGAVGLLRFDGLSWVREVLLKPADIQSGDRFGRTLALDGDRLVATAPGRGNGAIYVFDRVGSTWQQSAVLPLVMPYHAGDIELRGDRFIIGILSGVNSGRAFVYELNGGTWTQTAVLPDPGADPSTYYGTQVAIDGDRAVVSSWNATVGVVGAGSAFVFRNSASTGIWSLEQTFNAPTPRQYGGFSEGLALNGSQLVASEGFYETVHVFDFQGSATFRNGSGTNPAIYSSGIPMPGASWSAQVDVTNYPGTTATVVAGFSFPIGGFSTPQGELLVLGTQLFIDVAVPSGGVSAHGFPIPLAPSLAGTVAYTQALVIGPSGLILGNAMDLAVGF